MSKNTLFLWVIFATIGIGGILLKKDGYMHLFFCDVGQGDASIIAYKNIQILIDGGPDHKVLDCLQRAMPVYDRTIEVMVASHPDADHIGGLTEVLRQYRIDRIITIPLTKDTKYFTEFRQAALHEDAEISFPIAGDELAIGGMVFSILWPETSAGNPADFLSTNKSQKLEESRTENSGVSDRTNDYSLTIKLKFGAFSALFTGDLPDFQEKRLVTSGKLQNITVLKVAHHGSKYSTSEEFLHVTRPELALIGVGAKNRYGHPANSVLQRLEHTGSAIFRTDLHGTVEITTDGRRYWVSHAKK